MFDRYVGIPWIEKGRGNEGCDCWGLLRLVYRHERGIELPSYSDRYVTAADQQTLSELISGQTRACWIEIAHGEEAILDGVLMREGREASHIGVVVSPGQLLHVERGGTSVIEPYRTGRLKHRVLRFYRYRCA